MPDIPRRVLVVETEKEGRAVLEAVLAAQGYEVHAAAHARRALDLCRTGNFDVAIVDLAIPGADGDPLWCGLRDSDPDLSIILVTSEADIDSAYDAIGLGAYDYLVEPLAHQEVTLRVDRAAERHELLALSRICQQDLESRIDERTHQISDGMQRLEASLAETRQARLEAVCLLSHISELHDEYTGNHLRRVSCYCQEVARGISCDEEFIEQITYSSPLHDIGKISTPPEILRKPGKLTPDEFEIIKEHTISGARLLEGSPFLAMAREIALTHHERYDGTGYPGGLVGDDIPLSGRIVAVADVFDALISRRPYREACSFERSIEIMSWEEGGHFAPQVFNAFLSLSDRIREIAVELSDEGVDSDGEASASSAQSSVPTGGNAS